MTFYQTIFGNWNLLIELSRLIFHTEDRTKNLGRACDGSKAEDIIEIGTDRHLFLCVLLGFQRVNSVLNQVGAGLVVACICNILPNHFWNWNLITWWCVSGIGINSTAIYWGVHIVQKLFICACLLHSSPKFGNAKQKSTRQRASLFHNLCIVVERCR